MLRRIWALTQKESIQLLRMPIVYIGLTIGPVLELILFAVAIRTDVQHIPMVVADQSLSPESQQYLNAFTQSQYFDIVAAVADQKAIVDAIDRGRASIGMLIPADFAGKVQAREAQVLVLVDGSNSFVTQAASADAAAISQQYAIRLKQVVGSTAPISALDAHFQILYNPDLQELWFLAPGFGAVVGHAKAGGLVLENPHILCKKRLRGCEGASTTASLLKPERSGLPQLPNR